MDLNDPLAGPSLPAWFLFPSTLIFAAIVLYVIAGTKGRAPRFLIFACWFRYTLSSLHEYSYRDAIPGLSWIALGSIITIGAGLIFLEKRRFITWALAPVAVVAAAIVLSALLNHSPGEIFEPVLRFAFFAIICVAVWQSLETVGASILRRLLIVFLAPMVDQLASVALGVAKSGELDGSVSYIGGYFHEQIFSLIMATCFLVVIFAPGVGRLRRGAIAILSLVGIYVANYRTTILAMAPLTLAALFLGVPKVFQANQRRLVQSSMIVFGSLLLVAAAATGGGSDSRFSDVGFVATQGKQLMKPPEQYTSAERQILNMRPYIWSWYIYEYEKADRLERIVGFGPDAWVGKFTVYAHNTVISFLYEMGIVGVAAILLLWGTMFRIALVADRRVRGLLISAHASFFVLNMATMPHSQIEGDIMYGILCGYTLAKARFARARAAFESRRRMEESPYALPGMA